MIEPTHKFRLLRGTNAQVCAVYYKTETARDKAAIKFAERDGQTVAVEEWSADHPQDELNQGWACTGAVHPQHVINSNAVGVSDRPAYSCHCGKAADYYAREVSSTHSHQSTYTQTTFGKSYAFCSEHAAVALAAVLDGPVFVVIRKVADVVRKAGA